MNSAKEVKVIVTESVRGKGTEENPNRIVTMYWSPDGVLLAEKDPFPGEGLKTLLDRAVDLATLAAVIASGKEFNTIALAAMANTVLDLAEKLRFR